MAEFRYMLAPIEFMTSNSFRTICYMNGADVTCTEMIKTAGLARKNKSALSRTILNDETPTMIQLLGAKESYFKTFLHDFEAKNGFYGFNLNLGCPSPQAVNSGQGCALIKRISKTKKIIEIFKDSGFNISIKLRLGMNKKEKEQKVYLNLIDSVDADFFIVHARCGSEGYNSPADFKVYEGCVNTGKTIIANGDITKKEQIKFLKDVGVKGAMIGRAAVLDPAIFNKLKGIPSKSTESIIKDYIELADRFKEPISYRKEILNHIGTTTF